MLLANFKFKKKLYFDQILFMINDKIPREHVFTL